MKIYKVEGGKILEKELVRKSNSSVWYKNENFKGKFVTVRESISCDSHIFLNTRDEAKQYIIRKCKEDIEYCKQNLLNAEFRLKECEIL